LQEAETLELQPLAVPQPDGQVTKPGAFGQLAPAAHSTSQAQAFAQFTLPLQLDGPAQPTSQAPVRQRIGKPQLWLPEHATVHEGDAPQSSDPHELCPMHWMLQGPLPQVAPVKQLDGPVHTIAHEVAPPHWMLVLQPWLAWQSTWQGMPFGHTIDVRLSPRIVHTPFGQPWLHSAGHTSAPSGPRPPSAGGRLLASPSGSVPPSEMAPSGPGAPSLATSGS
jgi:hypothetical protein